MKLIGEGGSVYYQRQKIDHFHFGESVKAWNNRDVRTVNECTVHIVVQDTGVDRDVSLSCMLYSHGSM